MGKEEVVPTLFVREATGITRELGMGSAIAMGLAVAYGSGINWYSTWSSYSYPGANVAIGYLLPMLTLLPYTLILMGFAMCLPRSGGGYIWYSRFFHPGWAVMDTWSYMIRPGMSSGLLAWFTAEFFGMCVSLFGNYTHNAGAVAYGTLIATNMGVKLAWTMVFIAFVALFNILGLRYMKWAVNATVGYGLIAVVIGYILYATAGGAAGIPAKWDAVWGAGAYQEVINVSNAAGFEAWKQPFSWNATVQVLVPAEWGYSGYETTAYSFAGETREPSKIIPICTVGTLIAVGCIYSAICALMYSSYGDFVSRYVYCWGEEVTDQFVIQPQIDCVMPTFTASLTTSPILQFIISSGAFFWLWNTFLPGPSSGARVYFAMAFDRFAPEWFATVNERLHSPVNAVLWETAGTVLMTIFAAYNVFVMIATFAIMTGVYAVAEAIGAVNLAFFRTDIYERGYVYSIAGIPWLAIVAIFDMARGLYKMGIAGMSIDFFSCYFIGICYGVGLFVYILYLLYNKRRGIDVAKLFTEMPPE